MIDRRAFAGIAAWGALGLAGGVLAQAPRRIALLSHNTPLADLIGSNPIDRYARAFVHGLRDLGWVEGRNLVIERRSAEGRPERTPAIVKEAVDLKVELLVVYGGALAQAAKQATATIPVVFVGTSDPVSHGLVASLARPGGNLTGLTMDPGNELNGKRLDLLKQLAPKTRRVACFRPSPQAGQPLWGEKTATAAQSLGLTLLLAAVDAVQDFEPAFAAMQQQRADAVFCFDTPLTLGNRRRVVDFAALRRLPAVYALRAFAEAGGLMSYSADLAALSGRAASYVDKILKGADPGELPVEQPIRFEMVLNLKTAKALGITIPHSVMLRATEVIE